MKKLTTLLLVWSACANASADVRLPRLFSDNMVLQQQTRNAVWGWADAGATIMVTASWGATASATSGRDGRWMVFLPTPGPGTGQSLTIRGHRTIEIKNIAIGEVWLCAGQSNMGWSMGNSFHAEAEANVNLPNLRIFKSAREHWYEPLTENRDRLCRWKPCAPDSAAETSAVAYYFGKTLQQALGIPVGIIQRAYAGTPIEGWMPWDVQQDNPRSQFHKASLDETVKRQTDRQGMTAEQALADFAKELAEYNAKIDAGETMKMPSAVVAADHHQASQPRTPVSRQHIQCNDLPGPPVRYPRHYLVPG